MDNCTFHLNQLQSFSMLSRDSICTVWAHTNYQKETGKPFFFFFEEVIASSCSISLLFFIVLLHLSLYIDEARQEKKKKGKWSQRGFLQYYLPTHWHDSSYKFGYHSLEGYLCFCETRMPKSMCFSLYFQIKTSELFFSFLRNEAAGNSPI